MNIYFVNTSDNKKFVSMAITTDSLRSCIELVNNKLEKTAYGYDEIEQINDFTWGNSLITITLLNTDEEHVVFAELDL